MSAGTCILTVVLDIFTERTVVFVVIQFFFRRCDQEIDREGEHSPIKLKAVEGTD